MYLLGPDCELASTAPARRFGLTDRGRITPGARADLLLGVMLAMLLSMLDTTIVGTAMPTIVRELGAGGLAVGAFALIGDGPLPADPLTGTTFA